ncbi:DUF2723 domain-containing protein [candidate division GN15 bacterium]|nr:DUF2723 domain-containing protein [candidate division GN15 bacterium]
MRPEASPAPVGPATSEAGGQALLQRPTPLFWVGILLAAIGMIFLATPPSQGILSLTIAPVLLLLAYLVLMPMGISPRLGPARREGGPQSRALRAGWYRSMAALVFLLSLIIYRVTLWPGPGWWSSSADIACSVTLGIGGPPGAWIPHLAGRVFSFAVPVDGQAVAINLLTALATSAAVALCYVIGVRLIRLIAPRQSWQVGWNLAAAVGALTLAFAPSIWAHATYMNPYAWSMLVGALLIYVGVRWWESAESDGAGNYLLLAALLFGLDLSVHRSTILLLPAFLVLVALRRPRALADYRLWLGGLISFGLGLSLHLGLMFRAQVNPAFNFGNPDTLASLWDYLTLKQYGIKTFGSDLLERKGPLGYQINDMYLRYLGWNFIGQSLESGRVGWGLPFGFPALVALLGCIYLFVRRLKLAVWLVVLWLCAAGLAVMYLNVPEGFFREMDRHFLTSFLVVAILAAPGVFFITHLSHQLFTRARRWLRVVVLSLLVLLMPVAQLVAHWSSHDMSDNKSVLSHGRNILETCEKDAILICAGDNDTYPIWYLQMVEGLRTDVSVLNISLLNTPWYLKNRLTHDTTLPWSYTEATIDNLRPYPVERDSVAIALHDWPEDSVTIAVQPSFENYLLVQDQVLLDILQNNQWRRKVYFTLGFGQQVPMGLNELLRVDGVAKGVVLDPTERQSLARLWQNLLERYRYEGLTLVSSADDTRRNETKNYIHLFTELGSQLQAEGRDADLSLVRVRFRELWPEAPPLDSLLH